jgi:hypothetical protein
MLYGEEHLLAGVWSAGTILHAAFYRCSGLNMISCDPGSISQTRRLACAAGLSNDAQLALTTELASSCLHPQHAQRLRSLRHARTTSRHSAFAACAMPAPPTCAASSQRASCQQSITPNMRSVFAACVMPATPTCAASSQFASCQHTQHAHFLHSLRHACTRTTVGGLNEPCHIIRPP